MAKAKSQYVCQQCGYKSPTYLGRCPNCSSWNSFVETIEETATASKKSGWIGSGSTPQTLDKIEVSHMERYSTGLLEFDRVLGGGILKGAVVLLSGDPGIGKSTILLHMALHLLSQKKKILYVSGEESLEQIKLRVERVLKKENIDPSTFYLLNETSVEQIIAHTKTLQPDLLIVDSIQTMETEDLSGMAGSVGQVREATAKLLRASKEASIPLFLVGHVTKEGTIAGPQVLAHMVDTVLFFEGERYQSLRLLRALKNRFGPVDEVGIFEMTETGFSEMSSPEKLFISKETNMAGKSIVLTLEGTRPLLAEIQTLVVPTKMAYPRRVVSGLDQKRFELMIAVIQKSVHLPLERFDIFASTTAGLKIFEPALDLGMCLSLISSFKNKSLPKDAVAISEVSLLGELRTASQMDRRVKESKRLGFKTVLAYPEYTTISEVVRKVLS